jgi:pyruvate/2-oxoglutarate dehydrogenase complex dihydrolipoamide dehydrogenase (E3) component
MSSFRANIFYANVNFENMLARKEDIINQMYQGVKHLMQHNHIDIYTAGEEPVAINTNWLGNKSDSPSSYSTEIVPL